MSDPGPVEPVTGLAALVLGDARERDLVDLRVASRRDQRRHAADRMRAAAVAGLHQELGVRPHERHGHRDLCAVGKHERRVLAELLDDAEDVVPAAGIQPGGVIAQLVEDRVHLEGRGDRLDQDGRAERAARDRERVLGEAEHVVPQGCLVGALELGQVEGRRDAALDLLACAADRVQPEVEEARRDGLAVGAHVPLHEVPASRSDDQPRDARRSAGTRDPRASCGRACRAPHRGARPGLRRRW